MTDLDDKRINAAEELAQQLDELDGVEDAMLDDYTPKSPVTEFSFFATHKPDANLHSLSQKVRNVCANNDTVTTNVDIKTRVNRNANHKDLIVKKDFPMKMYFLCYAHWGDGEIQAIELNGYAMKETVEKKGEDMNIHNSQNNRPKILLEQQYLTDLNQLPIP